MFLHNDTKKAPIPGDYSYLSIHRIYDHSNSNNQRKKKHH